MLLESNVEGDVVVLAIVGMGGLGKTALAQLVFDDPRIREEFSLRLWVCVSDQDQNKFNVDAILASIYKSINPQVDNAGGLDSLVRKVRDKLEQHKYLLVLDDLWTENHNDWLKLKGYLVGLGQRENKIVVTTRSLGTATAVESNNPYELKALSDEKSWQLFERVVGKEQANYSDFVEIGKNIVKKMC
uniref:NB-ARC domain-containing protein n=1 Tax=Opuntia streptacantha TaxID=393608 RepID=A0A7C9AJS2_OPUST